MNALNKYNTRFLLLLLPLIACSCSRKDIFSYEELYNGAVPISLDWQGHNAPTSSPTCKYIYGAHTFPMPAKKSVKTLCSA